MKRLVLVLALSTLPAIVTFILGYLAGQFLNAYVLVAIKRRTAEHGLWVRLIGSTVVGELADTVVFCSIAFGPLWFGGDSIPLPALVNYILVGWIYKCLVEALCLPVTYRVIAAVKRHEPDYWDAVASQ